MVADSFLRTLLCKVFVSRRISEKLSRKRYRNKLIWLSFL